MADNLETSKVIISVALQHSQNPRLRLLLAVPLCTFNTMKVVEMGGLSMNMPSAVIIEVK